MPKNENVAAPPRPLSARAIDVRDAALTLFADRGYHATSMKDIAGALQLQAQSLYNHVSAKQDILRDIMAETMTAIARAVRSAIAGTDDKVEQLRRATEAHVRYHARHAREVRVGNHEIAALEEPDHSLIAGLRREYARIFVDLIASGVKDGVFDTRSPRLAAYAILQLGIGVSRWYRPGGELTEDDIVFQYGDMALRIAGVVSGGAAKRAALAPVKSTKPRARSKP